MNFENSFNNLDDKVKVKVESKERPEKLFRAFTISQGELTLEKFKETLRPLNVHPEDPTKVRDGNELGVYMSTNERMVEQAYATGGDGTDYIEVPKYNDSGAISDKIILPSCGVVVEVETSGLDIRIPEISSTLQGVYNNGFEGDEWIADEIPPEFYKVKKLMLSRWANDRDKFVVKIEDDSDAALEQAIKEIKEEFAKRRQAAEDFKGFLESLSENRRIGSHFMLKRAWEKYKEEKQNN